MKSITQTLKNFLLGFGIFYLIVSVLLLVFRIPGTALLIGFITVVMIGFIAIILIKLFVPDGTNTGIDKVQVYAKGIQDFMFRTGKSLKTIFKESKALSFIGLTLLIIFCYKFVKQDLKDNEGLIGIIATTLTGDDSFEFKLSDLNKYEFYNPFGNGGKMTEKERAKMDLKQYDAETARMKEERKNSIWNRLLYGDQTADYEPEKPAADNDNDRAKELKTLDQSNDAIYAPETDAGNVRPMTDAERKAWTDDGVDYTNRYSDVVDDNYQYVEK